MKDEAPRERSGDPGRWPRYLEPDERLGEHLDTDGLPLPSADGGHDAVTAWESRRSRARRSRKWLRLGVVVAVVSTWGAVSRAGGGEQEPEPYPAEAGYQPIATAGSFAALAEALTVQTGGTDILELRGYGPDEMQVTVPPAQPDDLAEVWRWDGSRLEKWMGEQAGDRAPFDLADVKPAVLVAVDEEARSRSDGRLSDSRYGVEKPVDAADHWIYVSVTEVDHGGVSLWADLDGDVESELVNKSWRDD
ncbi:hypothetical protein [Nocardioides daeguensis]|uniref:Uncharacterized protein n=1 Tax=Nocardioides daeguensis TaxID=908359 RepID=A0ABP6WF15_9ACTN|nr:hypothetical protein [Nocardioides daeguensis]MBV6727923.1 hypothetical protein [Nocardioides daeguensis]MCR1771666.1 hypothetical protein [Nocardioides daeguensis]